MRTGTRRELKLIMYILFVISWNSPKLQILNGIGIQVLTWSSAIYMVILQIYDFLNLQFYFTKLLQWHKINTYMHFSFSLVKEEDISLFNKIMETLTLKSVVYDHEADWRWTKVRQKVHQTLMQCVHYSPWCYM